MAAVALGGEEDGEDGLLFRGLGSSGRSPVIIVVGCRRRRRILGLCYVLGRDDTYDVIVDYLADVGTVCVQQGREQPLLDEEAGDGPPDGLRGVERGGPDGGGQGSVPLTEGGLCVWGLIGGMGVAHACARVGRSTYGDLLQAQARCILWTDLLCEPLVGLDDAPGAAVPDAGVEEVAVCFCVCGGEGVWC